MNVVGTAHTHNIIFLDFHGRRLTVQILPIKNDREEVVSGMLVVQDNNKMVADAAKALRE